MTGLPAPASSTIPLFDFLPTNTYRWALNPTAPPCPTTCTDFGAEVYPQGFRRVLRTAGSYGLPVYVTENGLADADDDMRRDYLLDHLRVLRGAMRDRLARVKGYLAWSLTDNFEWSAGLLPQVRVLLVRPAIRCGATSARARVFRASRFGTLPAGHSGVPLERRGPVYIGIGTLILIIICDRSCSRGGLCALVTYGARRAAVGPTRGAAASRPEVSASVQTLAWWTRSIPFFERCRARYGKRFTVRLLQSPPAVYLTDPAEVKEVFTAPPEVLHPARARRCSSRSSAPTR